jgi:hypothetical protein
MTLNLRCSSTSLRALVFAAAAVALSTASVSAGPAQFVIVNINAPGVGFNDPTPAAPVGGNTGTTLGQQRLIAFEHAAKLWSARLDSNVPVRIRAQFVSLAPGVLGSAGPLGVNRDFPNAPLPGTWYHSALANKLAGVDLIPGVDDIGASFSTNFTLYLGLDTNHGTQNNLVTILLHEFAHGLGFSQLANLTTGALFFGLPDHYNSKLLDTSVNLYWPQMTDAQRATSATQFGRVVWDGAHVTAGVPDVLSFGSPSVHVTAPASIAGVYQFGTAIFGPAIGNPNVSSNVVAAVDAQDAAGPASTDGCSPFLNAGAVLGKIALVERGTCGFDLKARNATAAGATAVIIYNNAANVNAGPPLMGGGINDAFVLIPTVSLRRADGLAILARIGGGVSADIGVDSTVRAGADILNRARVFAPFPVSGASSISHFDTVASRNLLMEPALNRDLTHKLKAPDDLTFELLRDVGWTFPDADSDGVVDDEDCNANSDRRPTIVIGDEDSGVPNTRFANGCTSADLIAQLADPAGNHGGFVSSVAHLTNDWVAAGLISGAQKGAIQRAAAKK